MMKVALTRGLHATIDDEYAKHICHRRWYASFDSALRGFYARSNGTESDGERNKKTIRMHREVMAAMIGRPLGPREVVDHINHDTLDNRSVNLRLASQGQNSRNKVTARSSVTGFKGVTSRKGRFRARIAVHGTVVQVGSFGCVHEAAIAYDIAALDAYGEFALTNFPREAYLR